ncbi:MAG: peroxiredoxin family protein [Thermomicrobiales bacterium]
MSTAFYLSFAALWVLVIAHSLLLLGMVRMVYQLQHAGSSSTRPLPGREAPSFSAVDLDGVPIGSAKFAGRLTALLFVSPNCPSCTATLAELKALNSKAQGNVIVICQAGRNDCEQFAASQEELSPAMVADEDERISRLFDITAVPMAVIIDEHNVIQSYGQPKRGEELQEILARASSADAAGVA